MALSEQEIRQIVRDETASEKREIQNVREIIREELKDLLATDRYTFNKDLELFAGRNIIMNREDGNQIGTDSAEKLGFWGVTPVDQPDTVNDPSVSTVTDASETTDNSTINTNFSNVESTLETLIDRLQEAGVIK